MPTQTDQPTRRKVTSTVVTETLPTGQGAQVSEQYNRPFWEVIHSLTPEDWNQHLVRIYRADERWEQTASPHENKFTEDFNEDDIFQRWGGGRYLLWTYGPPSGKKVVIGPQRIELEGAPKIYAGGGAAAQQVSADPRSSSDPVLQMLIEEVRELRRGGAPAMMQETMKQSMDILANTYRSAAAVVRETQGSGGGGDDELREFRRMMMQKMMNPPDPMESIKVMVAMGTGIVTAVKELSGSLSLGGGKQDWMTLFADKLPMLGEKAVEGIREYRLIEEAQERRAGMQGGRIIDATPNAAAAPADPAAPAGQAAPGPTAVPPQQTQEADVPGPSIAWVLLKVAKTIETSEQTQATGEDLYDFLMNIAPELVDQLKGQKRDDIIALFRNHPQLSMVLGKKTVVDNPRLPKMIDEFLACANASNGE